jgi:hypothetical protein
VSSHEKLEAAVQTARARLEAASSRVPDLERAAAEASAKRTAEGNHTLPGKMLKQLRDLDEIAAEEQAAGHRELASAEEALSTAEAALEQAKVETARRAHAENLAKHQTRLEDLSVTRHEAELALQAADVALGRAFLASPQGHAWRLIDGQWCKPSDAYSPSIEDVYLAALQRRIGYTPPPPEWKNDLSTARRMMDSMRAGYEAQDRKAETERGEKKATAFAFGKELSELEEAALLFVVSNVKDPRMALEVHGLATVEELWSLAGVANPTGMSSVKAPTDPEIVGSVIVNLARGLRLAVGIRTPPGSRIEIPSDEELLAMAEQVRRQRGGGARRRRPTPDDIPNEVA